MKKFILILILSAPLYSFGQVIDYKVVKLSDIQVNRIANSIYLAEGGDQTKYPYGIKSVQTLGNKEVARKICIRTINHQYNNWLQANKPEDFVLYLSRSYCPLSDKNDINHLNSNWVKNVRFFIKKAENNSK